MKKHQGTTLIELLIVTTIFLILLAVIVFALGSSRIGGSACASNEKNIAMSLRMYVNDYDGTYPPAVVSVFHNNSTDGADWLNLLAPYLTSGIPHCPDLDLPASLKKDAWRSETCGYAYNARLNKMIDFNADSMMIGRNEAIIAFDTTLVTLYDARACISAGQGPDIGKTQKELKGIYSANYIAEILAQTPGALRHRGGANYAFADSHVKWLRPEQINKSKQGDGIHPGFGL